MASSLNEHTHNHEHNAPHDHDNVHNHTNIESISKEEVIALLSYMIDHNKHHEDELHSLSHNMNAEASQLVHDALEHFSTGNNLLNEALTSLKNN